MNLGEQLPETWNRKSWQPLGPVGGIYIYLYIIAWCLYEQRTKIGNNFENTLKGDFLMMLGVLSASCFTVFSGKFLKKYGNIPVMIYVIFIGTILNFFISIIFGNSLENLFEINARIQKCANYYMREFNFC